MNKSKRALFICGTPFHVISSIILRYQLGIDADIIIYDEFANTDKIKDNLCSEGIFKRVRILSHEKEWGMPKSSLGLYLYAVKGYFSIKKRVPEIIPEIDEYTDVFYANDQHLDIVDRYICCYAKKYIDGVKLHCIEDGWGSYEEDFYRLTKMDYLFRKYVVRGKTHILDMDIHLYSATLYGLINPNAKKKVSEIDIPGQEVIDVLKRVFSYIKMDDITQYDTIIFDTVRDEEFIKDGSERFNAVIEELVDNKKVIVKSHPRETKQYLKYDSFKEGGFPFELLCLYNDFSNYTFINNYSSAVFTPKLIFGQEPKIIFTYKKLSDYMNSGSSDKDLIVDNFIKMYSDNSKIEILN